MSEDMGSGSQDLECALIVLHKVGSVQESYTREFVSRHDFGVKQGLGM